MPKNQTISLRAAITPTRTMTYAGDIISAPDLKGLDADLTTLETAVTNLLPTGTAGNILTSDGAGNATDSGILASSVPTSAQLDNKVDKITPITPGTYGSATEIPVPTFNAQGQATAITTVSIPSSGSTFKGNWDATANNPTLADGTGNNGDYYNVSVAGSQTFDGSSVTFNVGDEIKYNGTVWVRIPGTQSVPSVFGRTGAVVATTGDYTTDQVTQGTTNKYYTTAQAQTDAASLLAPYFITASATVDQQHDLVVATIAADATLTITPPSSVNMSKVIANDHSSVGNLSLVDSTAITIPLPGGATYLLPGQKVFLAWNSVAQTYTYY
jgi:hypothetical protein